MMRLWISYSRYTQYPIIRNGLIRNSSEFLGKFKKRALGTGIDLTKRKSGMHFFEMQVETKKN